ncbi:hypothetical protein [Trichoplusia ni ascovirus 2c]|uniref:hypothetical protein n=1 Tax=Trichoplusia ni ascovirus 2c TaxID=328615 RepID=UPI0000E4423C|nr:hypothetical protein TNAV2c_gp100 [Trichoplusia ni ascovirus 2c]ABF70617.1 hypothetical protein [Trichoplusia ni ascovirus 2c]
MQCGTIIKNYNRTPHVPMVVSVNPKFSICCWWDTEPIPLDSDYIYRCPVNYRNAQREHVRNGYRFNESVPSSDNNATVKSSVDYVGCFCSIPCCLSWARRAATLDPMYSNSMDLIKLYTAITRKGDGYDDVNSDYYNTSQFAPDYTVLTKFGGDMSIELFRSLGSELKQTSLVTSNNRSKISHHELFCNHLMMDLKCIPDKDFHKLNTVTQSLLKLINSSVGEEDTNTSTHVNLPLQEVLYVLNVTRSQYKLLEEMKDNNGNSTNGISKIIGGSSPRGFKRINSATDKDVSLLNTFVKPTKVIGTLKKSGKKNEQSSNKN